MEIERKFLIDSQQIKKSNRVKFIEQTYLSFEPEVRIRKVTNKSFILFRNNFYYLTVKSEGNMIRNEFEIKISKRIYKELLNKAENKTIIKRRYEVQLENGLIAEIDEYKDFDFNTVEVEFKNEEQARNFIVPEWFGIDITRNNQYKNKNLARNL